MKKEPARELGLEPRALRWHQQAAVAHGHELDDARRVQVQRERHLARVDAAFELLRTANSADEIDVLVTTRIDDAEHGPEQLVLADGAVERRDGIGGVVGADAHRRGVPGASDVNAERLGARRLRRLRGGYVEARADRLEQGFGSAPVEIADDAVVGHDLHLIVREHDREERVVLAAVALALPMDARGRRASVVAVRDVERRDRLESGRERAAVVGGERPEGVAYAVLRREVVDGRGALRRSDDRVDAGIGRVREEHRLVVRPELVDVARAVVFLVGARLLVLLDDVRIVFGHGRAPDDADVIKKHEKTRADKEDDRTRHIDELGAHDEPVFLTYPADAAIDAIVATAQSSTPVYDFVTKDGVGHTLWALAPDDSRTLAVAFESVAALYVADGHHRSAAASRVHRKRKGDGGEHDAFLAVVFPHDQMKIMAYNRVVRDLEGRAPEVLLEAIRSRFDVAPAKAPEPPGPKAFGIYVGGAWYTATVRVGTFDASDPVASLDCSICQDQLLGPVFRVVDPRRDKHVDFVGGIRGAKELERRVDSGEMSLAIHLHPTSIVELMAVSDRGLLMPPKSTWFEPKLASGLFLHTF